jgi:hypothetical protein
MWIGCALGVLGLCGTLTAASVVGDTLDGTGAKNRVERGEQALQRGRGRHGAHRVALARFVNKLNLTDAQRGLALQEARGTQPIVDQARRDAARILVAAEDARAGGQTVDVRAELKSLRQQTFEKIAPMARQVLASLTPEQHQAIADAAAKHGRKVDEDRLVRRTAFLLTRPMTAAILEARLGH